MHRTWVTRSFLSYETSEFDDNVFDDKQICNDYEHTSVVHDNEKNKHVILDDYNHHS